MAAATALMMATAATATQIAADLFQTCFGDNALVPGNEVHCHRNYSGAQRGAGGFGDSGHNLLRFGVDLGIRQCLRHGLEAHGDGD